MDFQNNSQKNWHMILYSLPEKYFLTGKAGTGKPPFT